VMMVTVRTSMLWFLQALDFLHLYYLIYGTKLQ